MVLVACLLSDGLIVEGPGIDLVMALSISSGYLWYSKSRYVFNKQAETADQIGQIMASSNGERTISARKTFQLVIRQPLPDTQSSYTGKQIAAIFRSSSARFLYWQVIRRKKMAMNIVRALHSKLSKRAENNVLIAVFGSGPGLLFGID